MPGIGAGGTGVGTGTLRGTGAVGATGAGTTRGAGTTGACVGAGNMAEAGGTGLGSSGPPSRPRSYGRTGAMRLAGSSEGVGSRGCLIAEGSGGDVPTADDAGGGTGAGRVRASRPRSLAGARGATCGANAGATFPGVTAGIVASRIPTVPRRGSSGATGS